MQTLYSLEAADQHAEPKVAVNVLQKNLEQSGKLFTYLVYFISETARFAEADAVKKSSKYLPSETDLTINTKISGNSLLWTILENKSFQKAVNEHKLTTDPGLVRRVYDNLSRTPEYKEYIRLQEREKKSEKKILEFIFSTLMLPDENFISDVEEKFINWDDDADMMVALMSGFLQKPSSFNFNEVVSNEKWEFARELIQAVINKRDYVMELIKPKLKNWDADRIASLDMILMQMGVCEFMYFETIPTKVTINECIDLAKEYSTDQSGHFVNGILDNIHKELVAENKIHKKTFRNSTL